MKRLVLQSAALLWGLQFAFLSSVLALLLVALFNATPAEIGWILAVYNASGFLASIAVPAYADRRQEYLRPLLLCALLTVALAGVLAFATALPVAVISLVALGRPAGVGVTLLFAHLRHSGADTTAVVHTRAVVSFAWAAGPPLATFIISRFGNTAVLAALAAVAGLNVTTTVAMLAARSRLQTAAAPPAQQEDKSVPMSRARVITITAVFVVLQATNSTVVTVMGLFVTRTLGLPVLWSGAALGAAAALEVPALLAIGRLSRRFSDLTLLASGCVAGIAYAAMAAVTGPALLIAAQLLNAWFFAVVAGTGLSLFQLIVRRPGTATGLYTNTRRLGAIASGSLIGLGGLTSLGYRGVFAAGLPSHTAYSSSASSTMSLLAAMWDSAVDAVNGRRWTAAAQANRSS
jgi:SET family sugar efflux transporter-like MFS transporter